MSPGGVHPLAILLLQPCHFAFDSSFIEELFCSSSSTSSLCLPLCTSVTKLYLVHSLLHQWHFYLLSPPPHTHTHTHSPSLCICKQLP